MRAVLVAALLCVAGCRDFAALHDPGRGSDDLAIPDLAEPVTDASASVPPDLGCVPPLLPAFVPDGGYAQFKYSAGGSPTSLGGTYGAVSGDFTGDGKIDVVAGVVALGKVQLFVGDGTTGLAPAGGFVAGAGPQRLAVGDLDGDGKLDVAVASGVSSQISILLNPSGTGNFVAQPPLPLGGMSDGGTGSAPHGLAVADFNRDGLPDLVATTVGVAAADNQIAIFLGTGQGKYAAPNIFLAQGLGPRDLIATDLNGDCWPDLAVANFGEPAHGVTVFLGHGDGSFDAPSFLVTGGEPSAVRAGDFNRDGLVDLIVANRNDTFASLFLATSPGIFAAARTFAVGTTGSTSLVVGDFNGDGALDAAVAVQFLLKFLLGDGAGGFTVVAPPGLALDGSPGALVAPIDGNTRPDLVFTRGNGNNLYVFLNTSN